MAIGDRNRAESSPRPRGRLIAAISGVAALAVVLTLAVTAQGYQSQEVPRLDASVWVMRDSGQYARVNTELAETVRALAQDSTPEQTVRRMDAIGVARERLEGNVAPLLAVEAMVVALRPQG